MSLSMPFPLNATEEKEASEEKKKTANHWGTQHCPYAMPTLKPQSFKLPKQGDNEMPPLSHTFMLK